MKKSLCLFFMLLFAGAQARTTEEIFSSAGGYWISYLTNAGKGILQIDETGRVLRNPKVVVPHQLFGQTIGATAIETNDGNIFMWLQGPNRYLLRATIDKVTLNRTQLKRTQTRVEESFFLQVTQRKDNNFVTAHRVRNGKEVLSGFQLNSSGSFTGKRWTIWPDLGIDSCNVGGCSGGVAADGRMAYIIREPSIGVSELYLQRLRPNGTPVGDPQLIDVLNEGNAEAGIWSADLTNELPDGKRFLVYVWSPQPTCCTIPNRLFLQQVNSKTGAKIGGRILLDHSGSGFIFSTQALAIAPDGKFVVYVLSLRGQNLKFLALDSSGHKVGKLKTIATDIASALDILRD